MAKKDKPVRVCSCGCGKRSRDLRLTRVTIDGQMKALGYFCTKRKADAAKHEAKRAALEPAAPDPRTVAELHAEYLRVYRAEHKASSYQTIQDTSRAFVARYGARDIGTITRPEARRWAEGAPDGQIKTIAALWSWVIRERAADISYNPFNGLRKKQKRNGRKAPTREEFASLLDGCDALGIYAERMRCLFEFASYSLMRPGELYALRGEDIDLAKRRIHVRGRMYRGRWDTPKSNEAREIVLFPQARAAVMRLRNLPGYESHGRVFYGPNGHPLDQPALARLWGTVKDRAKVGYTFYRSTKYYGAHRLYEAGVPVKLIAAQAGWSEKSTLAMVRLYCDVEDANLTALDALAAAMDAEPSAEKVMHE
jgi:integrase